MPGHIFKRSVLANRHLQAFVTSFLCTIEDQARVALTEHAQFAHTTTTTPVAPCVVVSGPWLVGSRKCCVSIVVFWRVEGAAGDSVRHVPLQLHVASLGLLGVAGVELDDVVVPLGQVLHDDHLGVLWLQVRGLRPHVGVVVDRGLALDVHFLPSVLCDDAALDGDDENEGDDQDCRSHHHPYSDLNTQD